MAHVHSSVGSRSSQRIPARQSLSHSEKMLLARKSWDHEWSGVSDETELHFRPALKQRRHRGSIRNSDESSNVTRSSSVASRTDYRLPMEVAPFTHTTTGSNRRSIPAETWLETSWLPSNVQSKIPTQSDNLHGLTAMNTSPNEVQRPPSPRSQIGIFQAERSSHPKTVYSGPLERYLAQEDALTELGGDREEEWGRLRAMRAETLRLRAKVREMRKKLQTKESDKSTADGAFIKYVREYRSASFIQPETKSDISVDSLLERHYAALQESRDQYGPLYDEYDKLEDLLDQQEFEMGKIEGRLYNSNIHDISTPEPTLLGLSSHPPQELHPLYSSYLSRLGDLDLAKERHQNMLQERDKLLYIQESRTRVGLVMQESDLDFLNEFSAQETSLLGEITVIEQDLERQKEECLEEGIELVDSSLGDIEASEDELVSIDSLSKESTSIEPSTLSLLLPKSDKDKVKLGVLITDFDEENKSNRINRWIRYRLQTSPLEVELLLRIFLHLLKIVDLRQWQQGPFHWQVCVSSWWEHDEANLSPQIFKLSNTHSLATESFISAMNSVFETLEKPATISITPGQAIRRTKSAPGAIGLSKVLRKDELSRVKSPLATF